mmetsp:Transcript_77814/g.161660  ORF Transcript_77814/g.161660 Transcript_77814/m.161660 type:complete len:323 (-) Transcript_77814:2-970(-)
MIGDMLAQLWTSATFAASFGAATPGGSASPLVEWSAGTLQKLLAVALELTRRYGSMKWGARRTTTAQTPQTPAMSPQGSPRAGSPRSRLGSALESTPRLTPMLPPPGSSPPTFPQFPNLDLDDSWAALKEEEMGFGEGELSKAKVQAQVAELLAEMAPMLRLLALCDVWRYRLESWSRPGSERPSQSSPSPNRGTEPSSAAEPTEDQSLLSTPLLERPALKEKLGKFDSACLQFGEAVAHFFSEATSPFVLWRYFLYRLGDPLTPSFELPQGSSSVVEALLPPRIKGDPSLPEVASLPELCIEANISGPSPSSRGPPRAAGS